MPLTFPRAMPDHLTREEREQSLRGRDREPIASLFAKTIWIVGTLAAVGCLLVRVDVRPAMTLLVISFAVYRYSAHKSSLGDRSVD